MTIDERLDAIARNLELLSGMHLETEKSLNQLIGTVNRIPLAVADHEVRLREIEG